MPASGAKDTYNPKKSNLRKNILSLAVVQAIACSSAPLYATNITVDSAADVITDDGNCTLREAIQSANSGAVVDNCLAGTDNDTISFDNSLSGSTITLGGTELVIARNLTIDGDVDDDGKADIEVNAANASRVLTIAPLPFPYGSNQTITLEGLTISGGNSAAHGGGVYCQPVTGKYCDVTISNSTITGNTAANSGGGIAGSSYNNNTFTLSNSTVSNNTAGVRGGGIYAGYDNFTLDNSTISDNTATSDGGGIYTGYGSIDMTNSTVSGNDTANGDGGGIYSYAGSITMTKSTISGNSSATNSGGGIHSYEGSITLTRSTISGNSSANNGGGLYTYYGRIDLTNSTISGNIAAGDGGGVYVSDGSLILTNSTISNNSASTAGGGMYISAAVPFEVVNSILANNTNGDCGGGYTTDLNLNNLVGDNDLCGDTPSLTGDPQLGALADNGGPTLTHMPIVGSPVLDAGDNIVCGTGTAITTDQRGVARDDGSCDIGAVEGTVSLVTPASVQFDSTTATISEDGTSITLNLTRSGNTTSGISVDYTTNDGTAIAPGDYSADTNTLNFATGITAQSVTIDITDDSDIESDEDFTLTLSNVQLVTGSAPVELGTNVTTTVTITDDDTPADTTTPASSSGSSALSPWWLMLIPARWLRRKVKS